MPATALRDELLSHFDRLSAEEQRRVLQFVESLGGSRPRGTPGRELLRFEGILDEAAGRELERAIEEGCEQVGESECACRA